jgi:hypothetical protein
MFYKDKLNKPSVPSAAITGKTFLCSFYRFSLANSLKSTIPLHSLLQSVINIVCLASDWSLVGAQKIISAFFCLHVLVQ